uniref:Uncharacterized protein n=1 Tax=Micrurus lemniscatus lemniscatus TaxID=129467 RepID=A0A2D4IRF3_MICLE
MAIIEASLNLLILNYVKIATLELLIKISQGKCRIKQNEMGKDRKKEMPEKHINTKYHMNLDDEYQVIYVPNYNEIIVKAYIVISQCKLHSVTHKYVRLKMVLQYIF